MQCGFLIKCIKSYFFLCYQIFSDLIIFLLAFQIFTLVTVLLGLYLWLFITQTTVSECTHLWTWATKYVTALGTGCSAATSISLHKHDTEEEHTTESNNNWDILHVVDSKANWKMKYELWNFELLYVQLLFEEWWQLFTTNSFYRGDFSLGAQCAL